MALQPATYVASTSAFHYSRIAYPLGCPLLFAVCLYLFSILKLKYQNRRKLYHCMTCFYLVTHCFPLYYFRLVASISMTSVVAYRVVFFPKASAKLIPFSEPTKHFSIFFTTIFTPPHTTRLNSTTYTTKKIPHHHQQKSEPHPETRFIYNVS